MEPLERGMQLDSRGYGVTVLLNEESCGDTYIPGPPAIGWQTPSLRGSSSAGSSHQLESLGGLQPGSGARKLALWRRFWLPISGRIRSAQAALCGLRPRPFRPVITEAARGRGGPSGDLQPSLCLLRHPLGPPPPIKTSGSGLQRQRRGVDTFSGRGLIKLCPS